MVQSVSPFPKHRTLSFISYLVLFSSCLASAFHTALYSPLCSSAINSSGRIRAHTKSASSLQCHRCWYILEQPSGGFSLLWFFDIVCWRNLTRLKFHIRELTRRCSLAGASAFPSILPFRIRLLRTATFLSVFCASFLLYSGKLSVQTLIATPFRSKNEILHWCRVVNCIASVVWTAKHNPDDPVQLVPSTSSSPSQ